MIEKAENAKPCPICGSTEVYVEAYEHHKGAERFRVLCADCMCQQDTGTDQTKWKAIDRWNDRKVQQCHAHETQHIQCKYSVNRGWLEDTCNIEERQNGWGTNTRHCGRCGADLDCDTRNSPQKYCPICGVRLTAV